MRHGSGTAHFDLTDVPSDPRAHEIDGVDDVLRLAQEVIDEYGSDPSDTRIERLARFVMGRLGGALPATIATPYMETCLLPQTPAGSQRQLVESALWELECFVAIPPCDYLEPYEARAFATEILRVADSVEGDSVH